MSDPISIIVNTQSGRVAAVHVELHDAITRSGLEASVMPCAGPEIRPAAEHAAARGHALIAAGGDGTVSTVAAVAMTAGRTFGVIPLGTLNHFARDVGIPLDIDAAVGVIATGWTRALGIGELNGRAFVNNISAGLYPHLVRERIVQQSRGRGKRIALAIALLRTWRSYQWMASSRANGHRCAAGSIQAHCGRSCRSPDNPCARSCISPIFTRAASTKRAWGRSSRPSTVCSRISSSCRGI